MPEPGRKGSSSVKRAGGGQAGADVMCPTPGTAEARALLDWNAETFLADLGSVTGAQMALLGMATRTCHLRQGPAQIEGEHELDGLTTRSPRSRLRHRAVRRSTLRRDLPGDHALQ